ncbi:MULTISPECIES: beta-N-acetylhexosaminidase [unclassified Paludibacterium]|uniref:beta-N-acetylhexosaminidase n=1 Tax=unclassified Paludibacterium TaxID=2618429 RepID=UPI001C0423C1|nr:beta-N-acetylhexosaminidase [Paludibacterium sp. B53371]BEV71460.1 beta-N-acetylhexosaminidase [Paludibacterium sp. THUN1379]
MTPALNLPRGPLTVGIAGLTLTEEERQTLRQPMVGAVILFRRNFSDVAQLRALTAEIRALRSPALLIAVDHEGGRVQRFLPGFTRLPPMRRLGELWQQDPGKARQLAETVGYVLAAELRACDIDLSFTPVLDLDWSRCAVIGDRAFAADPDVVSELALALQRGLARGGMNSCGKHFPGHGWVEGDSHHVIPHDERSLAQIRQDDLVPFARMTVAGMGSVMPAHVVYPAVDSQPAGFSRIWLQDILRGELQFDGVIFSDDLCMEGAAGVGGIVERARAAFDAGCDMALVCNRPDLAAQLMAELPMPQIAGLAERLARMEGRGAAEDWRALIATPDFADCQRQVAALVPSETTLKGPAVGEAH